MRNFPRSLNCRTSTNAAAVLLGLALVLLAGCAQEKQTGTSTPGSKALKVALLTTGPVTDGGWNQTAYDGLLRIQKELGATISKQETPVPSSFQSAFEGYAQQGYNIVYAHGDEYADAAAKVAAKYPKTMFVTTGGDRIAPNLAAIEFATEEGTYLQGMQAGFISKSGKGGFVGGQELAPVKVAALSFKQGMLAANPKAQFSITYIGNWSDSAKAKAFTEALMADGADVIAHNCDAAASGLFQAAAARTSVYTFGVNSNQNSEPGNVVSSTILDIPKAFVDIAKTVKAGTFKGQTLRLGAASGDVYVVDNPRLEKLFTPEQTARIKQAAADIAAGKIKIASN
ncbi:MAG: BMP family protein [Capsulimonadaceae bacterium]|nr:BMP family protein [Capsulimonadaceae bacterium]